MTEKTLIPNLFKTEYGKIVSVLCKTYSLDQMETAQDIVSDVFLLASETWGTKGIPENPAAWLYTVAKNKTKDLLKRDLLFSQKIAPEIKNNSTTIEELDLSPENINDSQLQMIFAICHPSLKSESQIGLALRILCGFGIQEIADAFLTSKSNINKRLTRAKSALREHQIKIEFPEESEIKNRIDNVLTTLYLLFNEGYYSKSQEKGIRKDLCFEAMRLTHLLLQNNTTKTSEVYALLALMCFHSSRFDSRFDASNEPVLYKNQDTSLWNYELIQQGNHLLFQSTIDAPMSKYQLEASIAFWHTQKLDSKEKWERILQLYNQLLQLKYSPIIALNRTYALSKANDKKTALAEALKINLTANLHFHMLLAELYDTNSKAKEHLQIAFDLAQTKNDRLVIQKKLEKLL